MLKTLNGVAKTRSDSSHSVVRFLYLIDQGPMAGTVSDPTGRSGCYVLTNRITRSLNRHSPTVTCLTFSQNRVAPLKQHQQLQACIRSI